MVHVEKLFFIVKRAEISRKLYLESDKEDRERALNNYVRLDGKLDSVIDVLGVTRDSLVKWMKTVENYCFPNVPDWENADFYADCVYFYDKIVVEVD